MTERRSSSTGLRRRNRIIGVLLGCTGVTMAGCGSVHDREDAAAAAASAFYRAVGAGDGAAACQLLTPAAQSSLADDRDCTAAVLDSDLPTAGEVQTSSVWGQAAQVVMGADTIFLTTFDDRWLVRAAGCEPDPPKSYKCIIEA